ncbi:MAG: APC family permease [Dehalococcoidia bacterium]|nr:APC family permease [Dehalococcoidia bacterium]
MGKADSTHAGEVKLGRAMGLGGGIALVVGSIIGMGIFALLAPITASAGHALWLAFIIAMFISAVGVIPIIQAASAIPRAGIGYLLASRLSTPLLGSVISLWAVLGAACTTCFVCIGFAGNIAAYWSWGINKDTEIQILSLIIPALFMGLYLFKLQLANWVQIVMVVLKVFALGIFAIAGLFALNNPIQMTFDFPQGSTGMILAIVLCYSTCMGFQVIAEMGEEIKSPKRNIPLSMIIGGLIVLVIYIVVGAVFINSIPYDYATLMNMKAPLLDSAYTFLPPGWVAFIGFGALFAAVTAINAAAMALPREFVSQARDDLLPSMIGKVDQRTLTPLRAVGLYFLVVMLFLLLQFTGIDIDFYGVLAAVGILLMTIIAAFVVINLPKRFPDEYSKAYIRIPRPWLIVIAIITAVTSIPFIIGVMLDYENTALIAGILIGLTALFIIYYFLRVRWLKKQGVDWEERTKHITGFGE